MSAQINAISVRVNTNVTVKFKPTGLGAGYLKRYAENAQFSNKFVPDVQGYYEMTLWQCMNVFGDINRSGGGAALFDKGDLIILSNEMMPLG